MIPEKVNVKEVESTVTGDVIGMTIDDAAMQHIMNVLTDLYSDPELAVLREYSTNAWDAQREIGETRPIEVSLPNALSPFLLIRDFGVGLSVDDIHNIYSKYGASTKRSTNDQVGMLGLGCKSALTYSDQFTVTSVQNGTRVQVVVSRNAAGAATMTVVETSATDEHSGTTIMVPAKRYNEFERKARDFFRFWEPGSVLVNDEEPTPLADGLKITDDIRISQDVNQSYVVMGNVAYPWDNPSHGRLSYGYHLVARVPIGGVSFPPNRESLMYEDEITNPTLQDILETSKEKIPDALTNLIEAAPTMKDALQLRIKWGNVVAQLGVKPKYTYKGVDMPEEISSTWQPAQPNGTDPVTRKQIWTETSGHQFVTASLYSSKVSAHYKESAIPIRTVPGAIWIEGYDRPSFTAGQKKKFLQLYNQEGLYEEVGRIETMILVRDALTADAKRWLDPDRIIPWSRVAAVKLPQNRNRATGSSGKIPGGFDIYTQDGFRRNVKGDDVGTLAASAPIYWINGNTSSGSSYADALKADGNDFILVCLPANRVEKFQRTFPQTKNVKTVIKALWESWWKAVTPTQREALALQTDCGLYQGLQNIDADRVDDPAIVRAVKAAKMDVDDLYNAADSFRYLISDASEALRKLHAAERPLKHYPLVDVHMFAPYHYSRGTSQDIDYLYRYINSEYAWRCAQDAEEED